MVYRIIDRKYRFVSYFNTETGAYIRTGILDENSNDTGKDPFMGSFPNLIDVGVMGHCVHGKTGLCVKAGIGCYQSGLMIERPNMTVDNFKWIAEQCRHKCNQFALGGRGDPDQHENFKDLLRICRENDIVPNFTTSGYGMTPGIAYLCAKYCGAVAVSWYRSGYTTDAIRMLMNAGVKTNIHYVLGWNTIDEAIRRLKKDDFPEGINAVIFLLHKPAGQGTRDNVLDVNDPRVAEFFRESDRIHPYKIGFDSCNVPGVMKFCRNVLPQSLDTCEGARFSCYIDSDMTMLPCSFDQGRKYAVQLSGCIADEDRIDRTTGSVIGEDRKCSSTGSANEEVRIDGATSSANGVDRNNGSVGRTIEEAWNSDAFERFRAHLRSACPECGKREMCMGGCPIMPEIVFCDAQERKS